MWFGSALGGRERREQLYDSDGYFSSVEFSAYANWLTTGRVFPSGALNGVNHPTIRDAPSVVFLALGECHAEAILRGEDLAAEEDGLGWIGALNNGGGNDVRNQVLVGRQSDSYFRICLEPKLAEHENEYDFKSPMELSRHRFLRERPFAQFVCGFLHHAEVVFRGYESCRAHDSILHLSGIRCSQERPCGGCEFWYYQKHDDLYSRVCRLMGSFPRGMPPRRPRIRENVNEAIRAREVRAVFPDGSVEILPTLVAVRKAKDLGLDLIVVSPTAEPPVAKAMDYGQWQYENKKKQHEAKRKQHIILVKELKFRPNTDDHDYDFKLKHAVRFLQEGNRVKAVV
jgi:hypothetical protein